MFHAGDRLLVWRPDPSLWMTVLWDAPTTVDIEEMVRLHDSAYHTPDSFDSLVDFQRVTLVDPVAFQSLAAFAERRRGDFHRQILRQALVRPPGMIGALVTGFFESFGFTLPVRTFEERAPALAWLRPDDAARLDGELAARRSQVAAPELRRVRQVLAQHHDAGMDLERCAQLLGLSARTLQRQLGEASTSFRTELSRARVEAAKILLQAADCKLAAVALEVGFASSQGFAAASRADGRQPEPVAASLDYVRRLSSMSTM